MKKARFNVLILLCLCLLFFINNLRAESVQDVPRSTISTTGVASELYPPDTAEMIIAIENTAASVSQAMQRNNTISGKVIAGLKTLLGSEEGYTVKTSSYSLQPVYENELKTGKNKLTGYRATNQVTVKTKQIKLVGELIDSAVEKGANRVENIFFSLSDNRDYCGDLLRQAALRARSEAETVATSLDAKITGIKDLSSSCSSEMRRPIYQFGMAQESAVMAKASVPVEAGSVMLQGSVRAVFYIDGP